MALGTSYRANIPRFFVYWTLVNMLFWLPIWIVFFQRRGMSLTQIGAFDAIGWVVMAAMEVPTGAVADTFGRKTSMAIGAAAHGLAILGVTAHLFSPLFIVSYLMWGGTFTFIGGADVAFLYDSLKADGRADEYPRFVGRYLALSHAASGAASLIGGWLATFNIVLCFYFSTACLLVAAGVALTFREPPMTEHVSDERPHYGKALVEAVRIAAHRPAVRYLIIFGALASVFPFLFTFMFLQPYAAGVGAPVWSLGVIVLAGRILAAAGSMASEKMSSRIGVERVLLVSLLVVIVTSAGLWGTASLPAISLFLPIAFFGAAIRPILSQLLNDEIPSAQRATILSLQSLLWTLSLAVVEPVLFGVAGHAGMPLATGLSAVIMAATTLPLFAMWRRAARAEAAEVRAG